jgi:hypothetical protein
LTVLPDQIQRSKSKSPKVESKVHRRRKTKVRMKSL